MADLKKEVTELKKQAKKRDEGVVKEVQQLRKQIAAAAKAAKRPAGQSPSDGAPSVRSKVLGLKSRLETQLLHCRVLRCPCS